MLQVSGREPGFPSSTVKTFRLPGRIVGGRGARGEGWDLGTADAPAVFDSETRRRGVARFNVGNNERVKLLVGFCLFVPRGVWQSVPAANGSLGPPRTPHVYQTETSRTPPNHTERAPFGFHPDLELGCDDLEYSWRLRRSGFELLLTRGRVRLARVPGQLLASRLRNGQESRGSGRGDARDTGRGVWRLGGQGWSVRHRPRSCGKALLHCILRTETPLRIQSATPIQRRRPLLLIKDETVCRTHNSILPASPPMKNHCTVNQVLSS